MTYGQKALHEIKEKNGFTQIELGEALDTSQTNVSNFLKGKVPISDPIARKMSDKFGYDYDRIKREEESHNFGTPSQARKPDKKNEALQRLTQVQNGKHKNIGEGKIVNPDDVIKIKTYIIPMKGFSGLKNAIYDDQYIMDNFAETTTEVPHYLYSPVSYRIQSSGNSMPISIPNNAWVTAVPVPEMMWMTYKFIEDKIYVLFHPYRGILFKYVRNLPFNEIELYSQNRDKNEYPDEKFKITDFRKILLAIKVESFI